MADWAYIAGLLEGEGAICIRKARQGKRLRDGKEDEQYVAYQATITIGMTDRGPVEYLASVWKTPVSIQSKSSTRKEVYRAYCPAAMLKETAENIRRHFRSQRRKKELDLILSLRKSIEQNNGKRRLSLSVMKYRHWLYEQMQVAKNHG